MSWCAHHLNYDKKRKHTLGFSFGKFRGYSLQDYVCGSIHCVNVNGLWNFPMLDSRLPRKGTLAMPLCRDEALVST